MELSKNVRRHIRLLICLHDLIEEGEGGEAEADGVRDEMDVTHRLLSDDERNLVEGLSGDLYSLSGKEICALAAGVKIASITELNLDFVMSDWISILETIRRVPSTDLSDSERAWKRGQVWQGLGHETLARLFFGRFVMVRLKEEQKARTPPLHRPR